MACSRVRMLYRPVAATVAQQGSNTAALRAFSNKLAPNSLVRMPSLMREFEDLFKPTFSPLREFPFAPEFARQNFGHVDILETKEGHVIKMDLPGLKKEDIKIRLDEDDVLTLSGERGHTEEQKEANYHRMERSFGKFSRSFRLPENARKESISAEMRDGVLSVSIPHAPVPERRVVDIPIVDHGATSAESSNSHTNANANSSANGASGNQ